MTGWASSTRRPPSRSSPRSQDPRPPVDAAGLTSHGRSCRCLALAHPFVLGARATVVRRTSSILPRHCAIQTGNVMLLGRSPATCAPSGAAVIRKVESVAGVGVDARGGASCRGAFVLWFDSHLRLGAAHCHCGIAAGAAPSPCGWPMGSRCTGRAPRAPRGGSRRMRARF